MGDDMIMASVMVFMAEKQEKLRGTGRTTRIIDDVIQQIFTNPGKWILVSDHHGSRQADANTMGRIVSRLNLEHQHIMSSGLIEINDMAIRLTIDPKKLSEIQKRLNGSWKVSLHLSILNTLQITLSLSIIYSGAITALSSFNWEPRCFMLLTESLIHLITLENFRSTLVVFQFAIFSIKNAGL